MKNMKLIIALMTAACLLIFGLWHLNHHSDLSAVTDIPAPLEPITAAVAADLHYLAEELTDQGAYFQYLIANADGKVMAYSEELLEAFAAQIIDEKPDVLILPGDLTFNGEAKSHEKLSEKLHQIEEAGIPILVLPGNHDLNNPMAAAFKGNEYQLTESIAPEQFKEIYYDFGYEEALSHDESSLSYVVQLNENLRILMLDTNTPENPNRVSEMTLAWAETQLEEAKEQDCWIITVSHQNILAHNNLLTDGYVIDNSEQLLSLYENYPIICNLSGHIHLQHMAQRNNDFYEIVTSSLAITPNQYGILHLEENSVQYKAVPVDVSQWASENKIQDSNLLNFEQYSNQFFYDTGYRQAMAALTDSLASEQLAQFFAEVNTTYFSGRMDAVSWNEDIYNDWLKENNFFSVYLKSIAEDGFKNYTEISFDFNQ